MIEAVLIRKNSVKMSTYYVPNIIPITWNAAVDQTEKVPVVMECTNWCEHRDK